MLLYTDTQSVITASLYAIIISLQFRTTQYGVWGCESPSLWHILTYTLWGRVQVNSRAYLAHAYARECTHAHLQMSVLYTHICTCTYSILFAAHSWWAERWANWVSMGRQQYCDSWCFDRYCSDLSPCFTCQQKPSRWLLCGCVIHGQDAARSTKKSLCMKQREKEMRRKRKRERGTL